MPSLIKRVCRPLNHQAARKNAIRASNPSSVGWFMISDNCLNEHEHTHRFARQIRGWGKIGKKWAIFARFFCPRRRNKGFDLGVLPYMMGGNAPATVMECETTNTLMALEKELETYKKELPNLLANEGKYVVISGDAIIGTFAAYEDALACGYERCQLKPFLVKKIQTIEQVQYFSRDLAFTCPT